MDYVARHLVAVLAAVAASSSEAVVSHVSAAVVHGLPVWGIPLGMVHLTRDRRGGGRSRAGRVLHAGSIEPDEVIAVDGVPVTTVARTVVDLARTLDFEKAVAVGDTALHLRKTTEAELAEQLARAAGRPGCPAARHIIAFLDGRSESVGESRSRVHLRASGLPMPQVQAKIRTASGSPLGRVDFLWPDVGLVGEFDGMAKYREKELRGDRTIDEVVMAEKSREDALRAQGLLVVRWTWPDLDQPERWLPALRRAATVPRTTTTLWRWE
jgi:hypothetical protein